MGYTLNPTNFIHNIKGGEIVFTAFGGGRGVYLSVWCKSNGWTEKSFQQILKFYYPGIQLAVIKNVH